MVLVGVVIGLSHYNEKIQISLLKRDLPRKLEDAITLVCMLSMLVWRGVTGLASHPVHMELLDGVL